MTVMVVMVLSAAKCLSGSRYLNLIDTCQLVSIRFRYLIRQANFKGIIHD